MSTITEFANELYKNSRAKGFYEHEDWLRTMVRDSTGYADESELTSVNTQMRTALQEHFGNRLLLIAGEAVEAHEELRAGRGVGELYFSDRHGNPGGHFENTLTGDRYKPEGVLAELADVAIRSLETIAGILANLDAEELEALRGQVPQSEYTTAVSDEYDPFTMGPVNVAEILNLKHQFNLSRAPKHGGKAF